MPKSFIPPAPVLKFFYASRVTRPWSVTEVRCLIGAAQVANRRAGITGVLAFTGNFFAQCLEGPQPALEALVVRIARDNRHAGFREVIRENATVRDFPQWGMELIESPQLETDLDALTSGPVMPAGLGRATLERIQREVQWRAVSNATGHGFETA